MKYYELTVTVPTSELETASAVAAMVTTGGFYIEDYSDMLAVAPTIAHVDYYDDELLAKSTEQAVLHLYFGESDELVAAREFLSERLSNIPHTVAETETDDSDWAESWKRYFKPFRAGDRLAVCPSWESYTPQDGEKVIVIDPGMAFGSGTHETTRLCLLALGDIVRGGERLLDMGCGSGILAVGAGLLGASDITAVDIDATAVRTAKENANANGVEMSVLCGDALSDRLFASKLPDDCDIIVANIVADVIITYADLFCEKLKPGGTLIVSGIIDTRAEQVKERLSAHELSFIKESGEGGWRALTLKRL